MIGIRCCLLPAALVAAAAGAAARAGAQPLTTYQIQQPADAVGTSTYNGRIVDCAGGVVTHKFAGFKPRVVLQDPAFCDGWGGIQVKDWTATRDLFDAVSVGDWVSLSNVEVEEFVGNTLLQYKSGNSAGAVVTGTGNPLPAHKVVAAGEIAAPVESPPSEWYVADHSAEKFESMLLTVEDVTVTGTDLGKERDNYVLSDPAGECWATDYMNADRGDVYHPLVRVGAHFDSVSGILEQYADGGNQFDYYQLLTTGSEDFVPEPGSLVLLLAGCLRVRRRRDFR